jgi:outer membrane protein TolC
LDKTKLETVLSVKKAYYTLLLAARLTELNKKILDNSNEHLEFLKARYRYGQASQQEILQAEASHSSVTQVFEASLNQTESARALLNNLLFLEKDVKIIPNADFQYTPKEVAYDEALLNAVKRRPEISQYEAEIEQAKKSIEIEKAGTRPTIYASWDYYSRSHGGTVGITGTSRNWNDHNIIGVTVSWPVFDGFATKANVDQAIVDLKEAQLTKEKAIKDIALELKNAYVSLKDAISKLYAVEADIVFYDDNLASINEKYNQGIASSLAVSDADLKYSIALFNKDEAIYNYTIAKASFNKAQGAM